MGWEPAAKKVFLSYDDAAAFREFFAAFPVGAAQSPPTAFGVPFCGGWVGFVSYEAYAFSQDIPFQAAHTKDYPLAAFARYDSYLFCDRATNEWFFVGQTAAAEREYARLLKLIAANHERAGRPQPAATTGFAVNKNVPPRYRRDIAQVLDGILCGDFFELNYTVEHSRPFVGDPFAFYLALRETAPAPMMAFLDFGDLTILSASPETFFTCDRGALTTSPIKGTAARRPDAKADEVARCGLVISEKDRAELLMVTDMLRNDLGRVCQVGSITVLELAAAKSFSHYHHLVSTIRGRLLGAMTLTDVFAALFPGGSITGAPKIEVMRRIDAIENRARGVYTGAIGICDAAGFASFNIPIRTVVVRNGRAEFAAGGGIVADSSCDNEYAEVLTKLSGIEAAFARFDAASLERAG